MPILGEDDFKIIAKLSACQISGTRGEGFGKSLIWALLSQGYPREKLPFITLGSVDNTLIARSTRPQNNEAFIDGFTWSS